jgi:hypothetical protein
MRNPKKECGCSQVSYFGNENVVGSSFSAYERSLFNGPDHNALKIQRLGKSEKHYLFR